MVWILLDGDLEYFKKIRRKRLNACGDVSGGFNPDVFAFQPKSQPSEAVVIWRGGATE